MKFGSIIFILSLVQFNIYSVDSKVIQQQYQHYLTKVVNHMFHQNGWISMNNLSIKLDSNQYISVSDLVSQELDKNNLEFIFCKIVHILNYKYNEIVKIFAMMLNVVVDKCEKFLNDELLEIFLECTIVLENVLKNSKTVFDKIYSAMSFISYINLNEQASPYTIVDDIYQITSDQYFKKNDNDLLYVDLQTFTDVKDFIKKVSEISNRLSEKNDVVSSAKVDIYFVKSFEMELYSRPNEITQVVNFKFQEFYNSTIVNYFENLGFNQLIHPSDSK